MKTFAALWNFVCHILTPRQPPYARPQKGQVRHIRRVKGQEARVGKRLQSGIIEEGYSDKRLARVRLPKGAVLHVRFRDITAHRPVPQVSITGPACRKTCQPHRLRVWKSVPDTTTEAPLSRLLYSA